MRLFSWTLEYRTRLYPEESSISTWSISLFPIAATPNAFSVAFLTTGNA